MGSVCPALLTTEKACCETAVSEKWHRYRDRWAAYAVKVERMRVTSELCVESKGELNRRVRR